MTVAQPLWSPPTAAASVVISPSNSDQLNAPTSRMNPNRSQACFADGWLPRAAIVGAGAMGSMLASTLGQEITTVMVCRNPERASRIIRDGVRTEGLLESSSRPIVVRTIADLQRVGGIDYLFIATKTVSIPSLTEELKPVLRSIGARHDEPFIVSFQNGIETARQLMDLLEYPRVLRMVLNIGAAPPRPDGTVEITFHQPPHYIGTIDRAYGAACRQIARVLSSAGFNTSVVSDIERHVWEKAILNAATSPFCALVNTPIGAVLHSPGRPIVESLLTEGMEVARAHGIELNDDYLSNAMCFLGRATDHTPSMVDDVLHGRPTEVGQLNRQIIEYGRVLHIPTPTHEVVAALIESHDLDDCATDGNQPVADGLT